MTKVVPFKGGIHLSIRAYAEESSGDRETITKRIRAASISPSGKRGGHPVYRLRDLMRAAYMTTEEGELDPDRLEPFKRHAFYKAEREKLQVQVERGELLSSLAVEQRFAGVFKDIAEFCDTVTDVLERDCGLSGPQVVKVEERIDQLREQLYTKVNEVPADDVDCAAEERG